jgi:AraC-like DNA-binding protein
MAQDKGLKFLRIRKVVTLAELALHLHCSPRTVQRRLAYWAGINSYNRNGSCYTLPEIATFDPHGLWRYRGAFFSQFGNLPETFTCLVANSQAGLTAAEAGELLGLRPSSFLWSMRKHPALKREKHQGGYVYFSSDPACYGNQRQQRNRMPEAARLPSAFEAVSILAEKIKHPALTHEELSRRLRKQKLFVAPETIETLFLHHGLTVKKTPHSI